MGETSEETAPGSGAVVLRGTQPPPHRARAPKSSRRAEYRRGGISPAGRAGLRVEVLQLPQRRELGGQELGVLALALQGEDQAAGPAVRFAQGLLEGLRLLRQAAAPGAV